MERAGQKQAIVLSRRTLVVLCGVAGSGKSTFAQRLIASHRYQGLRDTSVVSSDYCRALICDDETNQWISRDSFDLFYYIIHKRMLQGRFTLADSTALQARARYRLLELAQQHQYHTCLFVFNLAVETCIEQDLRRQRKVGRYVIDRQLELLQTALKAIPGENWQQVYVLEEAEAAFLHKNITIENTSNLR